MVGTFSVRGVTPDDLRESAEEDPHGQARQARLEVSKPVATYTNHLFRTHFFGHFEMFCNGDAISLGRNRKALTILKYLLAHRARPVSQDHLMDWLWPESNLMKARSSLNSAVHILRKLLAQHQPSATANYILLEEGYYRLCPTVRVETDVDEFGECYEKGRRLEKEGRTEEAAAEYEKALELYRGDYLMEDLYEDWTMVERERLMNAYVDLLSRLAVHYI